MPITQQESMRNITVGVCERSYVNLESFTAENIQQANSLREVHSVLTPSEPLSL